MKYFRLGKQIPSGIALLLTSVFLLFGARCFFRPPAPPVGIREVPRYNLASEQGRLYERGQTNPFTGKMLEFYPGGAMQSRSMISNGLLNGLSEGWYTNGMLQVREQFVNGVSHGLRTKWHTNGVVLSEAPIVHGKIHGVFRRWDENAMLSEEIEMNDGQPDGISKAYFPNGELKAEARITKGRTIEYKSWREGESREKVSISEQERCSTMVRR